MIAELLHKLENIYFSANDIIQNLQDANVIWLHCEFTVLEREISALLSSLPESTKDLKGPWKRRQVMNTIKRDALKVLQLTPDLNGRQSVVSKRKLEKQLIRLMSWCVMLTNSSSDPSNPSRVAKNWAQRTSKLHH